MGSPWRKLTPGRQALLVLAYLRKGERRSMSEADYSGLITAAHQELHAPLILIWDNLNTHISATMRTFISAHSGWLTEVRLPAYALDLNPVEGAWANMKNGLGNLAAANVDQLTAIIKNRLKGIQYRPALIDGFLAQTGLTLEPSHHKKAQMLTLQPL